VIARPDTWNPEAVNEFVLYHGRISGQMTAQRTALESALIPMSAYILVAAVECYRRYPELIGAITNVSDPATLGRAGRHPGSQVDPVHLWAVPNFPLLGRQVMAPFGLIDPADDADRLATLFEFWQPAAAAFRDDGHVQAWDANMTVPRYDDDVLATLLDATRPIDSETRDRIRRTSAALTSYLFLLYFDTRSGSQDSGPYPLSDGRALLVRDLLRLGPSHYPWSVQIGAQLPYSDLTLAFVLDGVDDVWVSDWGTTITQPDDWMDHVVEFGLCTADGGSLRALDIAELGDLGAAAKSAQRDLYRLIAGMTRKEKIDAGAYVYFTFIRAFAEEAGIADDLDWSVPRDSLDVYDALSTIDKIPDVAYSEDVPYYTPIPLEAR